VEAARSPADSNVAERVEAAVTELVEAAGSPADSEGDSTLPVSSNDTAVVMCEHSEQLLVYGSSEMIAENAATSGEMCLPVQALVKRGNKSIREDPAVRYPSITGTLSERCVQSVAHIIQVFVSWHLTVAF